MGAPDIQSSRKLDFDLLDVLGAWGFFLLDFGLVISWKVLCSNVSRRHLDNICIIKNVNVRIEPLVTLSPFLNGLQVSLCFVIIWYF